MISKAQRRNRTGADGEASNGRIAAADAEARPFELVSDFQMTGDQPRAVARLTAGVKQGLAQQTLMGVTGSGKTFSMANVIQEVQRPTLVMAHNKTLAAPTRHRV